MWMAFDTYIRLQMTTNNISFLDSLGGKVICSLLAALCALKVNTRLKRRLWTMSAIQTSTNYVPIMLCRPRLQILTSSGEWGVGEEEVMTSFSPPYTPKLSVLVKCIEHTVIDDGRSLLRKGSRLTSLWSFALKHVI